MKQSSRQLKQSFKQVPGEPYGPIMPIDKIIYLPSELQGDSKVEDPGQGLVRMRGEAPTLASDVLDLVSIHQSQHEAVEHGQHLSHWRQADAAPILAQGRITAPVEPIFDRPMGPDQLRKTLGRTALL